MASKFLSLFFLFFPLVISPLIVTAHEKKHDPNNFGTPFDFLKNLQGCRKGDKSQDILKLKLFLQKFGYLNHHAIGLTGSNHFDGFLETALRTYQLNYRLKPTGILDSETVAQMSSRFGMTGHGRGHVGHLAKPFGSLSFHFVPQYASLKGNLKWSKHHLTYAFDSGTPAAAVIAVTRAFKKSSSVSRFTFSLVNDIKKCDIKIGFRHEDGPFDVTGGVFAHATASTSGRLQADGGWAVRCVLNRIDIETVAFHEIGHILGLEHSSNRKSIKYPSVPIRATKDLINDDVQGITTLFKARP